MQVLSVVPFGKGKTNKRYHLHVYIERENIEAEMPLYFSEMRKYQLEEGCECSDDIFYEICEEILMPRIITRCEYLLYGKAYTEHELRSKLKEGYYPSQLIDKAIEKMYDYHFLDDEDYAARYIELNSKKKSLRMIAFELKQKGIAPSVIEEKLYELEHSEEDTLYNLALKKSSGKDLSDPKEYNKLMRFFFSKGFNFDEISAILEKIKYSRE